MKKTKTQKGITLVALVITIIVLLILAVIAIRAVQNDKIINYAKNATGAYKDGKETEQGKLQGYEDKIEESLGIMVPGKIVTGTNAIYTEKVGEKTLTAIIPVGFCVVKGIEGDTNTIGRGLVISDVAEDDLSNSKGGNQFVWIPVEEHNKFHIIGGYSNKEFVKADMSKEAGDTNEVGSPLSINLKGTTESKAMYQSVKDNKGFYIARYEAGISSSTVKKNDGSVKPLSQKGVDVWNNIPWGGTDSDVASDGFCGNDSAEGAVKVARSMYKKNNTYGATSTLCYGVQWDAVMNYIDPNFYNGECLYNSFVVDSYGSGVYGGSVMSTGQYQTNHIYDLAGNVAEWTMEGMR